MIASAQSEYLANGFQVLAQPFAPGDFAQLTQEFLASCHELTGYRFDSIHDAALCRLLCADLRVEAQLYDVAKVLPALQALAFHPRLTQHVATLMPRPFGVFEKAVLRIDLPHVQTEVAHWHQDYFYVRGNTQTITAWIPLQDVDVLNGCLQVASGSHAWGPLEHPRKIGKRDCPSEEIMQRIEPTPVPMALGDALLFHSLLLHSGQLNRSNHTRYSVQYRYSPVGLATDPSMGALLPVNVV